MYNITFKWILGAQNKAADSLFQLVEVPNTPAATNILINMAVASAPNRPATHTHSKTKTLIDIMPAAEIPSPSQQDTIKVNTPPPFTEH